MTELTLKLTEFSVTRSQTVDAL